MTRADGIHSGLTAAGKRPPGNDGGTGPRLPAAVPAGGGQARDTSNGAVWILPAAETARRSALAEELHISPVTAQILLNRGITTAAAARSFFYADAANLIPPEKFPGLTAARERLVQAIEKNEKILIYGDYDVDGLAATAVMLETLARLGAKAEFYLPDRLAEGYGLKERGLAGALEQGCSLVVTVDCGITSVAEVRWARQQGLDLVITDHHRPGPELPAAIAVLNPALAPDLPPLCGAGVAFKLAQALAARFGLEREEGVDAGWVLDLVALATLADAVPLLGENRLLVQLGLPVLSRGKRPGLKALAEVAGLPDRDWTAREVTFGLIPRLNACGRLGDATPALELLTTDCPRRSQELAALLERKNQVRRTLENNITVEAEAMAIAALAAGDRGLVLASPGWHPGVVGIVAARLVEKYNCPVILLALEGDTGRGSGRSTPEINLHQVLSSCASHLLSFGGHAGAAGVEIEARALPAFRDAFNAALAEMAGGGAPAPVIAPEAEVLFSQLDWQLLAQLESLAPHGEGNPRPLLFYRGATLKTARQVGSDSAHLKLLVAGEGRQLGGIGFHMQLPPGLSPGDPVDLAFFLDRDSYQGREELQLLLQAVRPSPAGKGQPAMTAEVAAGLEPSPVPAATGPAGRAVSFPTWNRQLAAALGSDRPPEKIIFATSMAVRQTILACRRYFNYPVVLRPLVPWMGRGRVQLSRADDRGVLITCHPFGTEVTEEDTQPEGCLLLSPLVDKLLAGRRLSPVLGPECYQELPPLLPFLQELLDNGRRVLIYAGDGEQMLHLEAGLQSRLARVRPAVDTFAGPHQTLLAREEALNGRLPLLVARREIPAWFYPADVVIFTYCPGSLEEVEIALPGGERPPEVFINTGAGTDRLPDLRRELVNFYRHLQAGTSNGHDLYIINNKGYHQRWYLAILEELGLVGVERLKQQLAVRLHPAGRRGDLQASRRYRQLVTERQLAEEFYRQLTRRR